MQHMMMALPIFSSVQCVLYTIQAHRLLQTWRPLRYAAMHVELDKAKKVII